MKYLKALLLSPFLLLSCLNVDCDELKYIYSEEECIIVVENPPAKSSWFTVGGHSPFNQEPCECKSVNRWWSQFSEEIEKGDTIIKRKGELTFNIHKRDTVIAHNWKCNGIEYK